MIPVLVLAAIAHPPAPLLLRVYDLGYPIQAFAVSADGTVFAAVRDGNQIDVYDARTGKLRHGVRFNDGDHVRALAFSPDGKRLAGGADSNAELRVWSVETGETLFAVGDHPGGVCGVAFTPDGRTIATAAGNSTLRLIDAATGGHFCLAQSTSFLGPDGTLWIGSNRESADPIPTPPNGFVRVARDGTILDFGRMWAGWAEDLAADLVRETSLPIEGPLFAMLGYDPVGQVVRPGGGLAATPMARR